MFQLERDFVKTAKACLHALSAPVAAGDDACAVTVDTLETLMTSAQTVQARAVRLAAARCLVPAKDGSLSGAFELRTLSRLVDQFEAGLLEIDTERADASAPVAEPVDELQSAPVPNYNAAALTAAQTLETVMAFAPDGNAQGLSSLIRFAKGERAELAAEMPAAKITAPKTVFLESLIAPVTSQALVSAHRAHKQVSLSYACEHIAVDSAVAPALQSLLVSVCDNLVDLSVRHPAAREAAGLPATGQIALTATQTARGLTLDVYCDDRTVDRDDLFTGAAQSALAAYQARGGDIEFKPGRASGVMLAVTHAGAPQTLRASLRSEPNAVVRMEAIA